MQKHDPIKILITLGFGSLLTLMSVLAYISLSQMDTTIDKMSRLVDDSNNKSRVANAMRDNVRLRGHTLIQMYLSEDPLEREALRLKLAEYGQAYRDAFQQFQSFRLTSRELKEVSNIKQITASGREEKNIAADILLTRAAPERMQEYFRAANQARARVIAALDRLIALQNHNASVSLADSVAYHKQTQALIVIIAAIAFFVGVLISLLVIRETTRKNTAIRHQANHDPLTNLVNRTAFEHRLKQSLESVDDRHNGHALCYLDLDQFKIINDTCGHDAGDELLKQITAVILNHVRERDTLGRLGGDEFGLLLENCSVIKALEICEGIVSIVKKHDFIWNERCYHVGVSIGLVPVTAETESVAKIMSEADMACYAAKDMGRNRVHVHELEGQHVEKMHQELSWVADISNTIESNRFLLFGQPIVPTTGDEATSMFEVLLRIKDDDGNIVSPGQYLPAAERFSLMREVDIWVSTEAIKFVHRRHKASPDEQIRLFINLSANSISDTSFARHIQQLLQTYPVPANSLCFEITETAAIKNIEQTIDIIHDLRKYQCRFALDDFGSGMSSLTYLKNLPVDYLKIDGAIVQNAHDDKISRAMVAAVNEIGKVMNIRTIAEYVENGEVFDHVRDIGIDYAQGYYISRPCALDEIQTGWQRSPLQQLQAATNPSL